MDKEKLILDGSKILWHQERLQAWLRGERIAPITIDMALSRACNFRCEYCYGQLQHNRGKKITLPIMQNFLDDCAELGVKGISFVSDGESTMNPDFVEIITYGHSKGLSMALGSNGLLLTSDVLTKLLPCLTYLRFNISAADPQRYCQIHGVPLKYYHQVIQNIHDAVTIKMRQKLPVTIGMQMVLLPQYADQIVPLARLGKELRPDYLVIKHCSDDEKGSLGVRYDQYEQMVPLLKEAEALSDATYQVTAKWSKILANGTRQYQQCYGTPFHLQLSGSGLVAPCGPFFHDQYKQYHIGNIVDQRFRDIIRSERYWDVMNQLASPTFNAQKMCGCLCLQHKTNQVLDEIKKGQTTATCPSTQAPLHLNFI